MNSQFQKPRDFISGLVVLAIGAFFFIVGRDLDMGVSSAMGAGYIPRALSIITIILGLVLTFKGWFAQRVESELSHIPWLGLIGNLGAVVFFGLTVKGLGLAPAIFISVLMTASTSRFAKLKTSLILALGMAIFVSVLFHYVLGLALPVFGPWLSFGAATAAG